MTMPTMQQALKLYEETMRKRCAESSRFELGRSKGERIHAAMVAVAAQMIASRLPEIDGEKPILWGYFMISANWFITMKCLINSMDWRGINIYANWDMMNWPEYP